MRYEINDSTALKVEFQQVELEDNVGNLGLYQPFSVEAGTSVPLALKEDKASIISVAVDVIF